MKNYFKKLPLDGFITIAQGFCLALTKGNGILKEVKMSYFNP